jgi:hypothetical protein
MSIPRGVNSNTVRFDPVQAALYWFLIANNGFVEFKTKRELAEQMRIKEQTLYTLLRDRTRIEPVELELKKHSLTLPAALD